MADPKATMGSDLTGLSCGHATSVGRGTSRGRGASAGPASGTASLGADATGRGRGVAGRGAGVAGRWLVGELPKKNHGVSSAGEGFVQANKVAGKKARDVVCTKFLVLPCFNVLQIENACNFITIVSMIQN